MMTGWTEEALGDVLDQVSRIVRVEPDNSYRLLGVRLKGKGAFHRETKLGSEISAKFLDRVKDGDFIYSRLYAWHGAFSLIGADLDGAYVSNEFPIFRAKPSAKIDLSYLNFWLRQSRVWKIVEEDCQGSTPLTRNRFKEEFFNALRIQLPRGVEQERIVAHLDAIEERLTRVQKLRESARLEIEALTTSLHFGLAQGRQAKLDQLLVLDEEQETIVPEGSYPQVGIRSFGMGMFTKPAVTGSETTYRSFNVLRPGKLVMSQVKGWEGAVGVVTDNLDGWFVSPEYRTFSCISNECDPSYLSFLVATTWFHTQLALATRGVGARRERVRPEKLLALEMPFPTIEKQKSAVKMLKRMDAGKHLSTRSSTLEAALIPSILDRVFNG